MFPGMPKRTSTPSLDELLAHAGWLRRLATQLVRDDGAADDLVQDTWAVALESPRRDGVPLGPWLAAVLRNRARQLGRAGSRRRHREQAVARHEALPSVEELSVRAEASRDLVQHVLELPEAQREVLLLRHFEGLESRKVAELLGVSEGAVRSRLARGHGTLRERLDQSAGGDRSAWTARLALLKVAGESLASPVLKAGGTTILGGLIMSGTAKFAIGALLLLLGGLAVLSVSRPEVALDPAVVVFDAAASETSPLTAAGTRTAGVVEGGAEREVVAGPSEPAPRTVGSVVQGVVVDSETGDPIPFLELDLGPRSAGEEARTPATLERIVTDDQGRFASKRLYSVGSLQASVHEGHDWLGWNLLATGETTSLPPTMVFNHSQLGDPVTLEVDLGLAYSIQLEAPPGVELGTLQAAVFRPDQAGFPDSPGVVLAAAKPRTLVRFVQREHGPDEGSELALQVVAGAWAGSAMVSWEKAWPLPEVTIALAPAADVGLRIADEQGKGPGSVNLRLVNGHVDLGAARGGKPVYGALTGTSFLRPPGKAEKAGRPPLEHWIRALPIGAYTLAAEVEGYQPAVEWLNLVQGEQVVDVVARRDPQATASIRGVVRTESGEAPPGNWRVWLRRTDVAANESPRGGWVEASSGPGPWVGSFEIANLAEGEYKVWVHSDRKLADAPPVTPKGATIRTGEGELEFVLRDGVSSKVLEVEIVDAATGAPVDGALAALVAAGLEGDVDPEPAPGGKIQYRRIALDGSTVWVAAEGYAVTLAPVPGIVDSDGVRRMRIELGQGWGALAAAIEIVDGKAVFLSGIGFIADGKQVGVSDAVRPIGLDLAGRPRHITVQAPGFVLDSMQGPIGEDGLLGDVPASPFDEVFVAILRRE